MSKLAKALTAAAGNAGESLYVEDVFSTYLYTGNGSTQTITNGIDLSGEGGLVWIKNRDAADSHYLADTERSTNGTLNPRLESDTTDAQVNNAAMNQDSSFNSDGFSIASYAPVNSNAEKFASWTFRKAEKFFDVVTYTGTGSTGTTVSHNLGSTPAFIIVKRTSSAEDWTCYHQSIGATKYLTLNSSDAESVSGAWSNTAPTDSVFTVGNHNRTNGNGETYVAYLFAHDAGGFGDDESIIKCGSYTGNGGSQEINLGFEAQWVLVKSSTNANSWYIVDVMRGISYGGFNTLSPNSSAAEIDLSGLNRITPTATGFSLNGSWSGNENGWGYIYIAIRRPMKTPESGTEVFKPVAQTSQGNVTTDFPVDMVIMGARNLTWGYNWSVQDRLRGNTAVLFTSATTSENTSSLSKFDSNTFFKDGWVTGSEPSIYECFRRATGFFDVVAYTGTGVSGRTVAHNLGVAPELLIVKHRSLILNDPAFNQEWSVYSSELNKEAYLNETTQFFSGSSYPSAPTSSEFIVGSASKVNHSGVTYIAYLFATLAGVSKVGSYTGTAASQDIDCGFSSGARFIMIKRTDAAGDWWVWDSARGIVAGNDPFLQLNTTSAEVTATDYIDPLSSGFTLDPNGTGATGLNASGGTYIFLAIA